MTDAASEIATLRSALAAFVARVETAEAPAETAENEFPQARAIVGASETMIAHLKLQIAKLRREQFGHRSERRARLIHQMELQTKELEAAATEDEIAADPVAGFERRRPTRRPFPEHLPQERVVIEALRPVPAAARTASRRWAGTASPWFENNRERHVGGDPAASKVSDRPGEVPGALPVHASNRPTDALPLRGPALTLPPLREDQPAAIRRRA